MINQAENVDSVLFFTGGTSRRSACKKESRNDWERGMQAVDNQIFYKLLCSVVFGWSRIPSLLCDPSLCRGKYCDLTCHTKVVHFKKFEMIDHGLSLPND